MSAVTRPTVRVMPDAERSGRGAVVPVVIPPEVEGLETFRAWTASPGFPEHGRIDWIDGTLELDMSPENLDTHGAPKAEIAAVLHERIVRTDRGLVYVDRARVAAPAAGLSAEPDVVVVLFASLEAGRVRRVPAADDARGTLELEGAPDIVVECVSRSSTTKDRKTLRKAYARAGIPEYWLVDARGEVPSLDVLGLEPARRGAAYRAAPCDAEGFARSGVLGARVRLRALPPRLGASRFRLDVKAGRPRA